MRLPVTGMAWNTPLGDDLETVWKRLLKAETGIAAVAHTVRLRNSMAAAVKTPGAESPPSERLQEIAKSTLERALAAAHLDAGDPDIRFVLGTSLGAYLDEADERVSLSAWAKELADSVGISSEPIVISTACSSGSDAILVGAEMIRAGLARCCVCGGVDVLTPSKRMAHSALGTMSPTMLRAFDKRHDGTLLGEGAAFIVLSADEEAKEPLAYLRGVGSANDASGMTAPDTSGLGGRLALERSLTDAGLSPNDVGLVNAHGSGTALNDATERAAFESVFGRNGRPLIFATKGNFGHSLGATGTIEAIALLMALRSRQVPPIIGLEQPDPEFPLPLAFGDVTQCDSRFGLSLTLGFGGFDTSLVFEAPQ